VIAAALVVATVAVGLVASRAFHHDSRVESALDSLPSQTLVANFTDWAAIRSELGSDVSSRSGPKARRDLYAQAYNRDYTTTSVLNVFDVDMAPAYGWTVLDSEWEMYGQSKDGAVDVLAMPDGFDFDSADDALAKLGYGEPDEHGVRVADDQKLAAIATGLTPQLSAVAVLPDDGVIVMSDAATYAGLTVQTIHGNADSLLHEGSVAEMVAVLADSSVSALLDAGAYACTAAGFDEADPGQQDLARRRIEAAGGISPTDGLTRSIDASGRLTVVMAFDSASTAEADLDARVALAKGEAPDQGGTFEERFSVGSAKVEGSTVVLALTPRSRDTQLLRDLGRGGLLMAACPVETTDK
jgi:hypothetical protein